MTGTKSTRNTFNLGDFRHFHVWPRVCPSAKLTELVYSRWDPSRPFDWCSVIPNAMLVAAGVLSFPDSFSDGICAAVSTGFDTDCNGATIGSILGMRLGISGIEPTWTAGLGQFINTTLSGYYRTPIDEAADRTVRIAREINQRSASAV